MCTLPGARDGVWDVWRRRHWAADRELVRRLADAQQAEFGQRQAAVLADNQARAAADWRAEKQSELEKLRQELALRSKVIADQV